MHAELDHLVVVAPTLADGVEFIRQTLGVVPPPGGAHPTMGTHNCLLKLGDKIYLEVIAIDPAAPSPKRPRWFGLDRLPPGQPPRLAAWIAKTDDIEAGAASAALGTITPMSRGALNWRITIPEDGEPPMQSAVPGLIEWPAGIHPANGMPDLGCKLVRLEVSHPDSTGVSAMLDAIGFAGEVRVLPAREPSLIAVIQSPKGLCRLGDGFSP